MKVLKKGSGAKGWSKKCICTGAGNRNGGCGAELLVEQSDLHQTSHTDMVGDTDYFVTFKCPECGVLTDIPESSVPVRAINLPRFGNGRDSR